MGILSATQAIQIAIDSIEQRNDLPPRKQEEAIQIMSNILEQEWYIKWDQQSIIDSLKEFKKKTGKAPTVTDLTEKGMPKSLTIQTHFHMSASLLLKQLFPENRVIKKSTNIYGFKTEDDWLNCFAEQFEKHKKQGMSCRRYDLLRDKGTPSWNTITRHCGYISWSEAIKRTKVDINYTNYNKKIKTATNIHIANTTSPTIEKFEAINKQRKELNLELYNILTNKK